MVEAVLVVLAVSWAPAASATWHWLLLLAAFAGAAVTFGSLRSPLNKDETEDTDPEDNYVVENEDPNFPGLPRYVPTILDDPEDIDDSEDISKPSEAPTRSPAPSHSTGSRS